MGQKDYQQCMVIKKLIELKQYDIVLHVCDTVREPNGLAMSSRNMRLSTAEKKEAVQIINTLNLIKASLTPGDLEELVKSATSSLESNNFKVDYVAIADAETLAPIVNWNGQKKLVGLIAAYLNDVRLIDNIALN
jgi:pantoate--beta-alanine ligase